MVQSYSLRDAKVIHHLIIYSLDPTGVHIPNDISIGSAIFAQLTAESPYTLQWAAPSPQNCLCMEFWTSI